MLNFTVGPVMSSEDILTIGSNQVPYFRTNEFSDIMLENEKYMIDLSNAPANSRAVFLTCSCTGSMEAAVMNCLSRSDKALIINGGSFGQRFADICRIHEIPYMSLNLDPGEGLTKEKLYEYDDMGFSALLVNINETSTGVVYDSSMIGDFCRKNRIFYICDCTSSFLTEYFDMEACGADVMITGSQKAIACPPGISTIVLSEHAIDRIMHSDVKSMYFDLKESLFNQERGQTPFTPAVGILLQVHERLKTIVENGGAKTEIMRVASIAEDFRAKTSTLPFELISESPSNALTAIHPRKNNAFDIYLHLKDEYGIWVCPNGGSLKDRIFRVGHIGALSVKDNDVLAAAFYDMQNRGLL